MMIIHHDSDAMADLSLLLLILKHLFVLTQWWRCMMLFVLITTNRSFWSPHMLSIKDYYVLESFTPSFYRETTGSLDRSVMIYRHASSNRSTQAVITSLHPIMDILVLDREGWGASSPPIIYHSPPIFYYHVFLPSFHVIHDDNRHLYSVLT
jgi:hypothetical protein